MSNEKESFNVKEYFENIVVDKLERFNQFIHWTEKDKLEFKKLLDELRRPYDKEKETTKSKGDRLENLVAFIIKKSYFFEIYQNVHTETNEIDEVIVLSDRGKQALTSFELSRELIPIKEDLFLGECKNYDKNLNVTYVGKFYSLMSVTGVTTGVIFTQKGLTGNSEGYKDAYGLTKALRMMENSRNNKDFCIITFTDEDYDKLLEGTTFFELVKAKKLELQLASNYNTFLIENKHDAEECVKKIISNI